MAARHAGPSGHLRRLQAAPSAAGVSHQAANSHAWQSPSAGYYTMLYASAPFTCGMVRAQGSSTLSTLSCRAAEEEPQGCLRGGVCRYRLQPEVVLLRDVKGAQAEQLAAELPGLVTLQGAGASRKAAVGDARQHEKLLEKVRAWSRLACRQWVRGLRLSGTGEVPSPDTAQLPGGP